MQKWEEKKRKKMGNELFLKKYISLYKRINDLNKIVFPLLALMSFSIVIWRLVDFILIFTFGNLIYAMIAFMLFVCLMVMNIWYFRYISISVYGKQIHKWKEEQLSIANGI